MLLGSQIVKAETIEELVNIVELLNADNSHWAVRWAYTDVAYPRDFYDGRSIELLKRQLIVNVVGKNIRELYISKKSTRGPKGDKLKQFFNAITSDPQDVEFLCEKYGIAPETTAKNHRRFDMFTERGITKIKNRKIFRQPVDG